MTEQDTWTEAGLDAMAAAWDPVADTMPPEAEALVHPGFGPEQRWQAWTDYAEQVRQREAIATGTEHWRVRWPDQSYDEALDLACEAADRARAWFLAGLAR